MHNLYTLRGAKVRDALLWSGYIDEAIDLFGGTAEVVFNSHHWPVWGGERVLDYLKKQRDTYRYIHDQTLRLAIARADPERDRGAMVLPESAAPVVPEPRLLRHARNTTRRRSISSTSAGTTAIPPISTRCRR